VQPEDRLSLHLLDAGAAGYLSKDQGADELLRAIQTVASGKRYLTPTLRELLALDPKKPPRTSASAPGSSPCFSSCCGA
jgi:two-component system invasion response regulator UvrY